MNKTFDTVVAHLQKQFPVARVEVEHFPSGAAMALISYHNKHWSLEFLPHEGFGTSVLFGDERDWLSGHDHIFQSEDELNSWLEHELLTFKSPLSLAAY